MGSEPRQHRERRVSVAAPIGLIHELRIEARRRGLKAEDLVTAILRGAVVADDLYAAVIDR